MGKFRRAAKIDKCQTGIVEKLRALPGVTVQVSHDDILIGHKKKTFWIELKDPDAISNVTGQPRPSEIKPSQKKLLAEWTGHYAICWTFEMVLNEIGYNN